MVASFVGRRNYNRFDIEDAVGKLLGRHRALPYWSRRQGTTPQDVESWRVVIEGERAWLGLRVADAPLHRRPYRLDPGPGALHPPLGAAMALLAGLRPDQRLLDPCAGSGTIPIEACLLEPRLVAMASDTDRHRLQKARQASTRAGAWMRLVLADVSDLPVRRFSVDRVVSDFPWGRQVGWAARRFEPFRLWRSLAEIMAPEGRFAILAPDPGPGLEVLESAGIMLHLVVPLSLSGTRVAVLVGGHVGSADD